MLRTAPAVFAVENEYQIMVPVERECLFGVRVGEKEYFDESNGILRSRSLLHRVHLPMEALDAAGEYTVCVRPLIERKPYRSTTEPVQEFAFTFKKVPDEGMRIYHISDAHNLVDEPVAAAKAFGKFDLLILNGDILQHSGDPEKFINVYEICSQLTGGSIPVVFSRGNHDMRGNFAEAFAEYTPNHLGNTYYTFRLGSLWGVVLDCGEDKPDDNVEYGHTVSCHDFRLRQSAFLKELAEKGAFRGAKYRVAVVHHPFTYRPKPPFDIEQEVYTEWAELLKAFDLQLMITGHLHQLDVFAVGGENDAYGQPCPILVGGKPWLIAKEPDRKENAWAGCGITLGEQIRLTFTHCDGRVLREKTL